MLGRGLFTIDNEPTEEWTLYPTIIKRTEESYYKEIILSEKIRNQTRERLTNNQSVRTKLYITYWDYEGKNTIINTDDQEMIAI